jgi:DNA gyrase subunit A
VTVSHAGYIKRVPLSTYRAQRRGGKGRAGMQTRDEDFVTRLFVANTHTPILFFSSRGQAYKEKVWRLPLAAPNARGKALVNMLPLQGGERITSIMPLPEDEASWEKLDVMFATASGGVRRNKLSDFIQVNRNGKIAMKLDEGDHIVGVATCDEDKDVLLTTAEGQCIRFAVPEVRVFKGRDSTGVRGIALAKGDEVISMAILRHVEASAEERATYLKRSLAMRRATGSEPVEETAQEAAASVADGDEPPTQEIELGAKYAEMDAAEQFVLTLSERGFGKRTSSYEYRITGRGGKGIVAMATGGRNGRLVASFPVGHDDQIMLVTDGGQLIRVPVHDIRIAGRPSQGVTVFRASASEKVVSVEHLEGEEDDTPPPEAEVIADGGTPPDTSV